MKNESLCPNCRIGRLRPHTTTLVEVVGGQLLRMPNHTLYLCDVCGHQELDVQVASWLDTVQGLIQPMQPDASPDSMTDAATTDAATDSSTAERNGWDSVSQEAAHRGKQSS